MQPIVEPIEPAGAGIRRLAGSGAIEHTSPPVAPAHLRTADRGSDGMSTFVVGVSGHRELRPDHVPRLQTSLLAILSDLKQRLPDSALRVMSGMAAGADLLVVQTALDLGLGVDAILPMPLVEYVADFDPESLVLLRRLLAHPGVRCRELSLPAESSLAASQAASANAAERRDKHYAALTQALIRGSSLLIALWDGESSTLPGGTADTVLRYLGVRGDRNKDDIRLQFQEVNDDIELGARLVYWIPAERAQTADAGTDIAPCYLAGLSGNTLLRLPTMPRLLQAHLQSFNEYNLEYQRIASMRRRRVSADSLLNGIHMTSTVSASDREGLERIDAEYGKADALAMYFQKRSDSMFAFFNLAAFATGLAYLTYDKLFRDQLLLFGYLAILVVSAGLFYLLHRRRWFAKHLMCRALAETLRVKFYLRLTGADDLVDAEEVFALSHVNRFHGFGWIAHVLISLAAPEADAGRDPVEREDGIESWIEKQQHYFERKVRQLHRIAARTGWLKRMLFGTIMAVVVVLMLLNKRADHQLIGNITTEEALTFLMGLIAVILASWELHQNKMAARELLWQYRNQLRYFARARMQLAQTAARSRRLEILAELGKSSLMESYLWTIHRFHRECEPPGLG